MKKWLFVALFVLFSIAPIPSAQAATLTWVLQDVMFGDGGTATGSFGYDADKFQLALVLPLCLTQ
jgi:hypothetical protein